MNPIEEREISCPHCGEYFDIVVDCTLGDQQYIEDCYICCRPIQLSITLNHDSDQDEITVVAHESF